MKMAPQGGHFLIPVAVPALDDHDAVTIPAPAAMPASVAVAAKFGTNAAIFTIAAEFSTIAAHLAVAANSDSNVLGIGDARRDNGERSDGGQRANKLFHVVLQSISVIRQRDKLVIVP
jgi:hypothetical protein